MSDHGHSHSDSHSEHTHHSHTHGAVNPSILSTEKGIWAIKWSFVGLLVTALFQVVVVYYSGSVALLADTIHNFADAATAVPLWIAFVLARRKPSRQFTYGLGRVEDLAGITIVMVILLSAILAGYQSLQRLIHPQPVDYLWAVILASVIGFACNEAVAVFRIRVGTEINSAALVAFFYDIHSLPVDCRNQFFIVELIHVVYSGWQGCEFLRNKSEGHSRRARLDAGTNLLCSPGEMPRLRPGRSGMSLKQLTAP